MEFTQDQKQYEETVPKAEEGIKNIANGAELTDEQLEIVAGGTGSNTGCIRDPFADKYRSPIENQ